MAALLLAQPVCGNLVRKFQSAKRHKLPGANHPLTSRVWHDHQAHEVTRCLGPQLVVPPNRYKRELYLEWRSSLTKMSRDETPEYSNSGVSREVVPR